ncbi:hypothetical protein B0H17DRAFT_1109863 [Mycena rosella]|uniref:Epoxide hydrolase N-terminal domain-containing protein n=1 Tax=Mycena rosella TaxID=1033263 RepID=A0AAD7FKF0_MYCRO|nr:hypothetical protein B0H17DRAFT_1109863 [Mycena rosella]
MASALSLLGLLVATFISPGSAVPTNFTVQPFNALLQNTYLPNETLYPAAGIDFGIELDFLGDLQEEWLEDFEWAKQEAQRT